MKDKSKWRCCSRRVGVVLRHLKESGEALLKKQLSDSDGWVLKDDQAGNHQLEWMWGNCCDTLSQPQLFRANVDFPYSWPLLQRCQGWSGTLGVPWENGLCQQSSIRIQARQPEVQGRASTPGSKRRNTQAPKGLILQLCSTKSV